MSLQQMFILAVAAMAVLAVTRLLRVYRGREPHLEGSRRLLFVLVFVFVPPIVLGALMQPIEGSRQLPALAWVPVYATMLAGIWILMRIAAQVVTLVAPSRSRRVLLLALVGSEGDRNDVLLDPPVTAKLAESVALVDRANIAFPRGPKFPAQIDRAGFRVDWDALDAATGTLEDRIADEYRTGLGVASAATATAQDARSRLDTLHRLAVDDGQAWAAI